MENKGHSDSLTFWQTHRVNVMQKIFFLTKHCPQHFGYPLHSEFLFSPFPVRSMFLDTAEPCGSSSCVCFGIDLCPFPSLRSFQSPAHLPAQKAFLWFPKYDERQQQSLPGVSPSFLQGPYQFWAQPDK